MVDLELILLRQRVISQLGVDLSFSAWEEPTIGEDYPVFEHLQRGQAGILAISCTPKRNEKWNT